jgi:aminoglycoside phosphotransferase (APT) family kinase protein
VPEEQRWLPRLAPQLPIPAPLALGVPAHGYPWNWSVHRWLDGEPAATASIGDLDGFAATLADFLGVWWGIDATGGPAAGEHNFFRGGPLTRRSGFTVTSVPRTCWWTTVASAPSSTSGHRASVTRPATW